MKLMDESRWRGSVYLDGWTKGSGGEAPVIEPATGTQLGVTGLAGPDDVAIAARAGAAAQPAWAALPYPERAAVLRRAGDLWATHGEEIVGWIVREAGSLGSKGAMEMDVAAQECYEAATLPSHPYGDLLPSAQPRLSWVQRVPVGVVGVISPFNFPVILSIRSVAPALALGNAVILKPDPRTAVCGGVAVARIFEEAGLPAGLLHVLPGGPDVGEAMITDPLVKVVSFTGSSATGRQVGKLAGEHLKRIHLELGGNSAMIVMDDVDLDRAVSAAAFGSFLHQGQICMTTGRHLVHEAIYDEYVRRLAEKAAHLPVGDPKTGTVALGPLIDDRQRDRVHGLVTRSVDGGARLAAGGTYEDLFYRPTVLAEVDRESPAYAEEVFGPVAPVARFSTVDEAVALAAGTEYGLTLSILSRDVMKGLAIAERIPTGIVHINDQTVNDEAHAPFGGTGISGTGARFGGTANLEAFTDLRWVTLRGEPPAYPF
jgi:benzaldehyde dehydrogenase (NAD)